MTPEMLMEIDSAQPFGEGAAIGSIEYRNFLTGAVKRWTVIGGNRRNNYALRTPDGRTSKPHGLTWILAKLRPVLLRF